MRLSYIRPSLFAALLREEADAKDVSKAEAKILLRIAALVEGAEDSEYFQLEDGTYDAY